MGKGGFTWMSNYHLRDRELSLKAKGLLSQMLSLPPTWRFTVAGMAAINRECKDTIRRIFQELEQAGYLRRHQTWEGGRFGESEYSIYDRPPQAGEASEPVVHTPAKKHRTKKSSAKKPSTKKPSAEKPSAENAGLFNIEQPIKEESNTVSSKNVSIPSERADAAAEEAEERQGFLDALEYDELLWERPEQQEILQEMASVLWGVVSGTGGTVRIGGENLPRREVQQRFHSLEGDHLRYVLDRMADSPVPVGNMRQFLLTALYNAPLTIDQYYDALVRRDLGL